MESVCNWETGRELQGMASGKECSQTFFDSILAASLINMVSKLRQINTHTPVIVELCLRTYVTV